MKTEVEAKFLDIAISAFREKLKRIGGKNILAETMMASRVFDYPDHRLEKKGGWIRVRDEGQKTTLSYKQLDDLTLHGTKEVSVIVDSAAATHEFLTDVGFVQTSYEEKKRESWTLQGSAVEIDSWPWIPTFVEVEGSSEEAVRSISAQLGLRWEDAVFGSVEFIYQRYFHITPEEFYRMRELRFGPIPDWLEQKRKTA